MFDTIRIFLESTVNPSPVLKTALQRHSLRQMVPQHAPHSATERRFSDLQKTEIHQAWREGRSQGIAHVIVNNEGAAEDLADKLLSTVPSSRTEFGFAFSFRLWDRRHHTVESCIASFLTKAWMNGHYKSGNQATTGLDETVIWAPQYSFIHFHEALAKLTYGKRVFLILANLTEQVAYNEWFLAKLDALDPDMDVHILMINTSLQKTTAALESSITVNLDAHAMEVSADSALASAISNARDTAGTSSISSASSLSPVVRILAERPQLYPLTRWLTQLFNEYKQDDILQDILVQWLRRKTIGFLPDDLENDIKFLIPWSFENVMQKLLAPKIIGPEAKPHVRWIVELVLYGVRPFTITELEDVNQICVANDPLFPALQISTPSLCEPDLFGLVRIQLGEIQFSTFQIREFLLSKMGFGDQKTASFGHSRIARACLRYLFTRRLQHLRDYSSDSLPLPEGWEFFSYAVQYWPEHARLAGGELEPVLTELRQVSHLEEALLGWAQAYWKMSNPATRSPSLPASAVSILYEHSLDGVVEFLRSRCHQQPVSSVERIQTLESAARVQNHELFRESMATVSIEDGSLEGVVTALISTKQESLAITMISDAWKTSQANAGSLQRIFQRATFLGHTKLMEHIFPLVSEEVSWHKVLSAACLGGHQDALLLVRHFMHSRSAPTIVLSDFDAESNTFSKSIIEVVCSSGQGWALQILLDKDAGILSDAETTLVGDCDAQVLLKARLALLRSGLVAAMNSSQSELLRLLLASLLDFGYDSYSDTFRQSLLDAVRTPLKQCSLVLFDHLRAAVDQEKLKDTALSVLEPAGSGGDLSILQLVASCAADRCGQVESMEVLWNTVVQRGDRSLELIKFVAAEIKKMNDAEFETRNLSRAISSSARSNNPQTTKFLLEAGADPNKPPRKDWVTALNHAVNRGFLEIATILLEAGADPNTPSTTVPQPSGQEVKLNPLTLAIKSPECVELLIKHGADINWKDETGRTALYHAIEKGQDGIAAARILLHQHANVDCLVNGATELWWACYHGNEDLFQALLDAGADPFRRDLRIPLLHYSVYFGQDGILERMLLYKVDVEEVDYSGDTPLLSVGPSTTVKAVKMLVRRGASVTVVNKEYQATPLSQAVDWNNLEVAQYLLQKAGADPNAFVGYGGYPLHKACAFDDVGFEMVKLLVHHDADVNISGFGWYGTPYQAACRRLDDDPDRAPIMELLLNHDAFKVNGESIWWGCNLNIACLMADLKDVEALVARGAEINAEDRMGRRPLHFAAFRPVGFLQYLVEKGADLNTQDLMQRNMLHFGALGGRLEVVKYVLNYNHQLLNEPDIDGWTPLLWAVRKVGSPSQRSTEQTEIVKELLQQGASKLVQGEGLDRRWTAFSLARYHNLGEEVENLVKPNATELELSDEEAKNFWVATFKNETGVARRISGDCNACLSQTFGITYLCDICIQGSIPGWEFTLCFKCYMSRDILHPGHSFHKTQLPEYEDSPSLDEQDREDDQEDESYLELDPNEQDNSEEYAEYEANSQQSEDENGKETKPDGETVDDTHEQGT
ncbi:ankyrin repeat-containing domain protein [Cercophora samala]|uniref:Ankyrin repeat-containing domain protein n=1 Tax=Cercophora samala TaxID=330535 RepID=A0AA40D961_9PEZI|nr:ankyrin repeat-containing domain protein [Cercophora samala]